MPFRLFIQYLAPRDKMAEGFPQTRGVWGGFLVVWGDKKVCYACFKGARQLGFYGHALPSTIPAREFAFSVDLWQFFLLNYDNFLSCEKNGRI